MTEVFRNAALAIPLVFTLVSAVRKNGVTRWVRVKSLAGEPCHIRPGIDGAVKANVPIKPAGDGAYDLELPEGGEAVLYPGTTMPELLVTPVAADPARCNYYGLPSGK